LALLQRPQSGTLQGGCVDEYVPAAILRGDEAEPLGGIVPFHRADHLDGRTEIDRATRPARRTRAATARELRPALLRWLGRAVIDRDDLLDLAAFLSGADA